jgi:uncharacterized protein YaeQ
MALQATRLLVRLALSHVDAGLEREEPVNIARHPSETQEHVVLRLLAWCLHWQEGLAFGPGLSTPDTPDLWAHDLTGRLRAWIECRAVEGDRLRRIVNGSGGAQVAFLVDEERRAQAMAAELDGWKRPPSNVSIAWIDPRLVAELAAREDRQQKWRVTIVGDHFYLEADGRALDGALTRVR